MKQHEKVFQQLCEAYLLRLGIMYLHLTTCVKRMIAGRFLSIPVEGMTGWPDLLIFIPKGSVLLVELKTEKGKLTDEQKVIFPALESAGYPVHVIRDLQAFKDLIVESLGRCKEEADGK